MNHKFKNGDIVILLGGHNPESDERVVIEDTISEVYRATNKNIYIRIGKQYMWWSNENAMLYEHYKILNRIFGDNHGYAKIDGM